MYVEIQKLRGKGYSQRQVSREKGIFRGTVKKYWKMSEAEYVEYRVESKKRFKKLDAYRCLIVEDLDPHAEMTVAIMHDHLMER